MNALDAPGASRARVHCLSDGSRPLTLAELGRRSWRAGAWLRDLAGTSGTVAALLTASHDCLATLFGALRSGATLVSLPHPARGMDAGEYLAQIDEMCALTGATHLACDPSLTALLSAASVPVHAFNECSSGGFANPPETPGRFVQFTSGQHRNAAGHCPHPGRPGCQSDLDVCMAGAP